MKRDLLLFVFVIVAFGAMVFASMNASAAKPPYLATAATVTVVTSGTTASGAVQNTAAYFINCSLTSWLNWGAAATTSHKRLSADTEYYLRAGAATANFITAGGAGTCGLTLAH